MLRRMRYFQKYLLSALKCFNGWCYTANVRHEKTSDPYAMEETIVACIFIVHLSLTRNFKDA
jgi:hypothetical protein